MLAEDREQLGEELRVLSTGESYWTERIQAELEFVEGLCRLHPTKAKRWGKLAAEAIGIIRDAAAKGRKLSKAVEKAETVLTPISKPSKKYTVHCVGHAHIDMNWLWSWPETSRSEQVTGSQ